MLQPRLSKYYLNVCLLDVKRPFRSHTWVISEETIMDGARSAVLSLFALLGFFTM